MHIIDYKQLDDDIRSLDSYYDNIDVTYLLRNHVISLLKAKQNKGNREISLNIGIFIRFVKSIIMTFPAIFKRRDVWIFSNAERRKKIGELYIDRVASIVGEQMSSTLYIENPVLADHKSPSKDLVLSDALFYLLSFLFSKIFFKKSKLRINPKLYQFARDNEIKLNEEYIIKRFIGQYRAMNFYLKYFSRPKLIFSVYPNGYYGYNYAFREQNIPIIELQHGIIYPLHPSYNTTLLNQSEKFKPDYVFTYGRKDKECLERLQYIEQDKIFVVGSYGLEKVKRDRSDLSDYLKERLVSDKVTVSIVATVNDVNELYNFAIELEEISKKTLQILLLPRLRIDHLEDTACIKVLDVKYTSIFEIYKCSNLLLTKSSTAALESLFMEIPTFIYEIKDHSIFHINYPYIETLNYTSSAQFFYSQIENRTYKRPSKEDIDNVYALEPLSNFNAAIEKINNV